MAHPPEPRSDIEDPDQIIQLLWSTVDTNMQHGMSCRCCGGGMFSISPQILETDLLDYLADKYLNEGLTPLYEAVSAHVSDPAIGLLAWLRALGLAGTLPAPLLGRLKNDIIDLLKNMQATPGF